MSKIRIIIFFAIGVLISFLSVRYTNELTLLVSTFIPMVVFPDAHHDAFSTFIGISAFLFINGSLIIVTLGYAICISLSSVIAAFMFRFLALRKEPKISFKEIDVTKKFMILINVLGIICDIAYGIYQNGISCVLYVLILTLLLSWQFPVFMNLIYISKLKKLTENL